MNLLELFVKIGVHDEATSRIGMIGNSIKSGLGTAAKVAGVAMAAAGTAAVAFGATAIKTGMEFDASMSQVAATMGTTVDQIGELRDFAQEMGRTTMFSATQAAEALNYMALAGYDAQTSMEMLPNVLNLAAAGSMDLATASDMVTDAQSAYGLSIEETTKMVDQMAKAASTGNTSVQQLGDAMLTVGATARVLNGGTAEAAQVLTLLADNGIKASEGGTALRNILMRLSAPTDKAKAEFEELGIKVFDAEGNMRPLQDVMLDIQEAMDGMSDSERQERLAKMFNKYDLAAVNALLGTNAERWDEVAASIEDCEGAAAQMAETQMDNLAGDITYLKSAFEGLQIAVSDELEPSMRKFVQGATDGIGALTRLVESDGFKKFADSVGNAFKRAVDFISGFLSVIAPASDEADAAGGSFDKMATALDSASGMMKSVTDLADGLAENLGLVKESGENLAESPAFEAGASLAESFKAAAEAIGEFMTAFTETADFDAMAEALTGLGEAIHDALDLPDDSTEAGTSAGQMFNDLADIIVTVTPIIAAVLAELKNEFETIGDVLYTLKTGFDEFSQTFQAVQEAISPFVEFIGGMLQPLLDTLSTSLDDTGIKLDNMGTKFEGTTTIVRLALDGLRDAMTITGGAIQGLMQFVENTPGRVSAVVESILAFVGSIPTGVVAFLGALPATLSALGSDGMNGFANGLMNAWSSAASFISSIPTMIWNMLNGFSGSMWTAGWNIMVNFASGIQAGVGQAASAVSSGLGFIRSFLPFSPAKRGPFSGKGWTYYSGLSIAKGFADGMRSGFGAVDMASMLSPLSMAPSNAIGAQQAIGYSDTYNIYVTTGEGQSIARSIRDEIHAYRILHGKG